MDSALNDLMDGRALSVPFDSTDHGWMFCIALLETNNSPMKIDHWKRRFLLEITSFMGPKGEF